MVPAIPLVIQPRVFICSDDHSVRRIFTSRKWNIVHNPFENDFDLIVFTGGEDLSPALYGQKKHPQTRPNLKRDIMETGFYHIFENKPKLGICRGAQLLNIKAGGSMYQHIDHHMNHHPMLEVKSNREIRTSSVHHQMMIPSKDAEIICISAECKYKEFDTVIGEQQFEEDPEVIWIEKTKALCIQGHPEYGPQQLEDYCFELIKTYHNLPQSVITH
jgi:GMP synthase-like glutamine amidotransferase